MSIGVCTFSNRSAIQPTEAKPAKSAPAILQPEYARVRLNKMRDGMVAATTISCIVSIPRLNARMLATRSQRPGPNPTFAALARLGGDGRGKCIWLQCGISENGRVKTYPLVSGVERMACCCFDVSAQHKSEE